MVIKVNDGWKPLWNQHVQSFTSVSDEENINTARGRS